MRSRDYLEQRSRHPPERVEIFGNILSALHANAIASNQSGEEAGREQGPLYLGLKLEG